MIIYPVRINDKMLFLYLLIIINNDKLKSISKW